MEEVTQDYWMCDECKGMIFENPIEEHIGLEQSDVFCSKKCQEDFLHAGKHGRRKKW